MGADGDQTAGRIARQFDDLLGGVSDQYFHAHLAGALAAQQLRLGIEIFPRFTLEVRVSNLPAIAMYERIGDARAFAIVEEHFRAMEAIVVANEGAVVKTMGDAVMASFASASQAVAAAVAMVRENDRLHGDVGLGVKIGVHAGPCLAVRANERLDFFGTTVNVAARLQAQAKAGGLVVTEELSRTPGVAALLDGLPREPFEATLKGIRETQRLVAVDLREPGRARSEAAA